MTLLLLAIPISTLCMDASESSSSSSSVSTGEFHYIIELPDGGLLSTVLEIGPADDMQYPSDTSWEPFSVPHKRYAAEMAHNGVEITQKIVDNCEQFIARV